MNDFAPPSDGSTESCELCGASADNIGEDEYCCGECGHKFEVTAA